MATKGITKEFNGITKEDVDIAGGKGASLGEMTNAKIPVPDGFVVLSNAFDKFLSETGLCDFIELELSKVDVKNTEMINLISKKIQDEIIGKDFPTEFSSEISEKFKKLDCEFVAVRSSATSEDSKDAAWAGQLDSYLNTTNENLFDNIKKCWTSLFTARAIFYRFEKGLHSTDVSVAVVVQKMIQSEVSGVSFSVHPVTQDKNQLIIEACFGLGEAIVSGSVTPDSYVVYKDKMEISDVYVSNQTKKLVKKDINERYETDEYNESGENEWIEGFIGSDKQKLSEEEILEITKIVINIENHYGFAVDVEWAIADGKIYVVQSRPITTLSF